MILKNKKITVMGLGVNGGGAGIARFLAESGAKVLVTDLKSKKELSVSLEKLKGLPIKYVLGKHREEDFENADMVIQNPGVPNNSSFLAIAKKNKIPIETDMGIFIQLCPSKNIIGIAGTKGKSTTSSLIYHLLKNNGEDVVFAGNIGVSTLDILPSIKQETIVALEISSWQLEGLKKHRFSPKIAVLTNVLPDHLDRYRNFAEYSKTEQLIYKFQNKDQLLVANKTQEKIYQTNVAKSKIIWFNKQKKVKEGCFAENGNIICKINKDKEELIIKVKDIPLLGEHNIDNVLAASIVAKIYGLSAKKIKEGIKTFKGVPHRLQFVKEIDNVKFYNDSAATTPDACLAAIKSFDRFLILILGGKDKKMPFEELVKEISVNKKIKKVFLLTHDNYDASRIIENLAKKHKIENKIMPVFSMKEAVEKAKKEAVPKSIVLLSPAAASFGMFKNEFDRGNQFMQLV